MYYNIPPNGGLIKLIIPNTNSPSWPITQLQIIAYETSHNSPLTNFMERFITVMYCHFFFVCLLVCFCFLFFCLFCLYGCTPLMIDEAFSQEGFNVLFDRE